MGFTHMVAAHVPSPIVSFSYFICTSFPHTNILLFHQKNAESKSAHVYSGDLNTGDEDDRAAAMRECDADGKLMVHTVKQVGLNSNDNSNLDWQIECFF